jgi:hypothetical protein
MGKSSENSREHSFGLLGCVKITVLEYEAPDIYAKLESSFLKSCPAPNGPTMDDGPTFDDDAGCMLPMSM